MFSTGLARGKEVWAGHEPKRPLAGTALESGPHYPGYTLADEVIELALFLLHCMGPLMARSGRASANEQVGL
jgi:hypothetical protein